MIYLLLASPLLAPFIARLIWPHKITWKEWGLATVLAIVPILIIYAAGRYIDVYDTEYLNGQVTDKQRVHGHYVRSYSCNCHSVCSGSGNNRSCTQRCSTCYEDRYTVKWWADTSVGRIHFDSEDSSSKRVYKLPDPEAYTLCSKGDPATVPHRFTNYIKASQRSLFRREPKNGFIAPRYMYVYDFYRAIRVSNHPGVVDHMRLNTLLNETLRTLGPEKRVNIVVVLTDKGKEFKEQLQNAWISGKKNDVVVLIGLAEHAVQWADAFTYGKSRGNERLVVGLRDSLNDIGTFDPRRVHDQIVLNIEEHYVLPKTEDYEYLMREIEPPTWLVVILVILSIGGTIALVRWMHKQDVA